MNLKESNIITLDTITPYVMEIIKYFEQNGVELRPLPKLRLIRDFANAEMPFGKTGYYDPNNQEIVLFITDRHIKDVLRSFAHELIHHSQYVEYGDVAVDTENVNDSRHLQHLEGDAYFRGNMLFRAWTDKFKGVK